MTISATTLPPAGSQPFAAAPAMAAPLAGFGEAVDLALAAPSAGASVGTPSPPPAPALAYTPMIAAMVVPAPVAAPARPPEPLPGMILSVPDTATGPDAEPPVDRDAMDATPASMTEARTPDMPPPPTALAVAAVDAELPAGVGADAADAADAAPEPGSSPKGPTPRVPSPAPVATTTIAAELRGSQQIPKATPAPAPFPLAPTPDMPPPARNAAAAIGAGPPADLQTSNATPPAADGRQAPLSRDQAAAKPQVLSPPTATRTETTPAPAEAPLWADPAPAAAAITDPTAKADQLAADDDAAQDVLVATSSSPALMTAPPLPIAMLVPPAAASALGPSNPASSAEPPATAAKAGTVAEPLSDLRGAKIKQQTAPDSATLSPAPGFAERLASQAPAEAPAPRQAGGDVAAMPGVMSVQPSGAPTAPPSAPATPAAAAHQPSVAAQAGRIGHEMGVEIARRVTAGGHELTVRMNPADMGRIEVRMAFDNQGTLRASVAAERPAALDLLRRDSADLHRALSDAGVRADAQSFRFDTRAGSGDQFGQRPGQHQHQQNGGRHGGAQRFYAGDAAADQPIFRALRTSGRVDLMA